MCKVIRSLPGLKILNRLVVLILEAAADDLLHRSVVNVYTWSESHMLLLIPYRCAVYSSSCSQKIPSETNRSLLHYGCLSYSYYNE